MEKLCVKDFRLGELVFVTGLTYKVELNPIDHKLYIYHPFGYSIIGKSTLDSNFL